MRTPAPACPPRRGDTQCRDTRRGFTVIEMAIVVVIIGLLAAMVIPRIGRGIAQRELDRVSQVLITDLQQGPQLAARHRRPVLFRAVGTRGYELVDRATPATKFVYRNYGTQAGGSAASFSGLQDVIFFPNGITSVVSASMPTFVVTVNGQSRRVTVSRVGHVRRAS